ncbi:hypothetical protein IFO68_17200, partial [Photobacterium sp. CAU 1568]
MRLSCDISKVKTNKYLFFVITIATFLYIYLEFISQNSIGLYLSLLLFSIVCVLSIKSLSFSILVVLFLSITIPEYPRDILTSYEELQNLGTKIYNAYSSVKIGPATLLLYSVIIVGILSIAKSRSFNTKFLVVYAVAIFIVVLSLLVEWSISDIDINLGLTLTNFKFLLVVFFSYSMGHYLSKNYGIMSIRLVFATLLFALLVMSIRVLLYVLNDYFFARTLSFNIQAKPMLALCVVLFFLPYYQIIFSGFRNVIYLSFFIVSRGEIILFLIAVTVISLLSSDFFKRFTVKLIVVIPLLLAFFFYLNPSIFSFFLWKISELSIFGGDNVSGSAVIRKVEVLNILCMESQNIFQLFFGKGLSGTYNFECVNLPPDLVLDLKSYSQDQLDSGIYYTVHTFIGSILLKFGIVGLVTYVCTPIYLILARFQIISATFMGRCRRGSQLLKVVRSSRQRNKQYYHELSAV